MAQAGQARASLRLGLGMLQIAGVGMALGIISKQGITALALLFVIVTTSVAVVSSFLWREKNKGKKEPGANE